MRTERSAGLSPRTRMPESRVSIAPSIRCPPRIARAFPRNLRMKKSSGLNVIKGKDLVIGSEKLRSRRRGGDVGRRRTLFPAIGSVRLPVRRPERPLQGDRIVPEGVDPHFPCADPFLEFTDVGRRLLDVRLELRRTRFPHRDGRFAPLDVSFQVA